MDESVIIAIHTYVQFVCATFTMIRELLKKMHCCRLSSWQVDRDAGIATTIRIEVVSYLPLKSSFYEDTKPA